MKFLGVFFLVASGISLIIAAVETFYFRAHDLGYAKGFAAGKLAGANARAEQGEEKKA